MNSTKSAYHQLFKVLFSTKGIAIEDWIGNQYSYQQVYNNSQLVANYISSLKLVNIDFVAIEADNNIESYFLILGCWLAGKGYVPIPSDTPVERKNYLLKQTHNTTILKFSDVKVEELQTLTIIEPIKAPKWAYLLFTSGTTGKPKGVPIEWQQLDAFWQHYDGHKNIHFTPGFNWLQTYELNFDVSVFIYLLCFTTKGKLCLLPNQGIKFLSIAKAIQAYKINVTSNVPTTARLLEKQLEKLDFSSVKYSFFSGDALYPNWAKAWIKSMPNAKVYNCYGPTETTIVCSEENLKEVSKSYFKIDEPLPVGEPFKNTLFKEVDGQLAIGGSQVFSGYYQDAKESFTKIDNVPYYLSGDDIRLDENGKWIFKGRTDHQIQIQGYRVELQEIQSVIKNIYDCFSVVISHNDYLYLFIVSDITLNLDLESYLPWYMLPKKTLFLKTLPLNKNQKIDYYQLKKLID